MQARRKPKTVTTPRPRPVLRSPATFRSFFCIRLVPAGLLLFVFCLDPATAIPGGASPRECRGSMTMPSLVRDCRASSGLPLSVRCASASQSARLAGGKSSAREVTGSAKAARFHRAGSVALFVADYRPGARSSLETDRTLSWSVSTLSTPLRDVRGARQDQRGPNGVVIDQIFTMA